MAVVWAVVAAALGLATSRLLRRSQRGARLARRWARQVAALGTSIWSAAFAAGAIGALAGGDNNPKLAVMMLGTLASAWLLWRRPTLHLAMAGYWLAGAWLLYGALISGHSPIARLFNAVALLALFAAGVAGRDDAEQGPA